MSYLHLIPNLVHGIQARLDVRGGEVDAKTHAKIEAWQCNFELKRLIQWYWFRQKLDLDGATLLSAAQIVAGEKAQDNLKHGRLQIGYCPTGDEIHLRKKDLAVLYWSHDESDDWDNKQTKEFVVVYKSVASLLLAIRNGAFVPIDSYAAKDYVALRKSERV